MSVTARLRLARAGFSLDVDLALPGSGFTGLVGPSGSGKTTLLRALAGLERLDSAHISVNGETWQDERAALPPHRRALGYVFQEASLFPHLDVLRNLRFGERRVPAAARRLALEDIIGWLDLADLLTRRVDGLSGGERQRVAIGRALAASPRLLLMDEPLAALDAGRKAGIMPCLRRLQAELDIPVIYVSHLVEEVTELARHLVLLEGGRVRASGPLAELLTRPDLPLAHLPGASAVVDARLVAQQEGWALSTLRFTGGEFSLPRLDRPLGSPVRLRIAARDVGLALAPPDGTSILNCLPARVVGLDDDGPAQQLVRLDAGGVTLLARITRRSADELGIVPGQAVFALVKSVALLA